ncbi:MAG: class I tRNA ligase family protein, partial [Treponema sp.]|nr:class I tRNA ligase family protein [Treponema sp.]
ETELFQFIGKDNIPFHTVIFPSSLLGSGDDWTMLHHMSSSEYLNYESGKFSKSRGIGVFGSDAMETGIPADVWRFYIFYNRPEKSDALFTWKDFQEKVNGELIGNMGNLVNRTLSFVSRYYDGKIPDGNCGEGSGQFWETVRGYEEKVSAALERANLRDAFHLIFEMSSFANKSFQDGEPWKKRNGDPADMKDGPEAAKALIGDLCYVVRDIAILLHPFMPQAAQQIASFFGLTFGQNPDDARDLVYKKEAANLSWDDLGKLQGAGRLCSVAKCEVLFAKLEDDKIAELRERYSGSQKDRAGDAAAAPPAEASEPADIRFAKTLDLRVAKILKIERHPKADKLYIETLEVANADGSIEERVIVSGLVPFYKEEDLLNKKIIMAYNLKPAKLRGVESRGMLLAASDRRGPVGEDGNPTERVEVLDAGDIPIGTRVFLEGLEPADAKDMPEPPPEIDIDAFFSISIETKEKTVMAGGRALTLEGKRITTEIVSDGAVR